MPTLIKDTIGLCATVTAREAKTLKKFGIPVFKGVLYKVNEDSNGDPIFEEKTKVADNTVVLGGAVLALYKLFGIAPSYLPPTINELEDVNADVSVNPEYTYVKCFGAGIGGAGMTMGSIYDPDFKNKELADWIPFRISDTDTLEGDDASMYYFRKQIAPDPQPQWGWFLKEFSNIPVPKSYWKDVPDPNSTGTEILQDISQSDSENLVESFSECVIRLTEDDLRPFFQWSGNLKLARYNSFALFTGIKKEITPGYNDYVGLRLFSVVNFNNVPLDMPTTATYLYRVYAAI